MQTTEGEDGMHASRGEFDAIVAPLERRAGRRINGANREVAFAAFGRAEAGFRECVASALLRRADSQGRPIRNPVGLLFSMLQAGEHLEAEALLGTAGASELDRALRWARKTGRLLPADARVATLDDNFDLVVEDKARVLAACEETDAP